MSKITRDYTLRVDGDTKIAPALSVFGGKITTYRRLAEQALEKLADWFPDMKAPWTAQAYLPGGALGGLSVEAYVRQTQAKRPALPGDLIHALVCRHGDATPDVLGNATSPEELGRHFGDTLYSTEVDYFVAREWALTADDVLWRRTKCGLHLNDQQKQALVKYVSH